MSSRVVTSCATGDMSLRAGTFDAVGDGILSPYAWAVPGWS